MRASLPLAAPFIEFHSPRIKALLDRYEEKASIHSTLLFTGIEGVGKKSLVLHFIQTLFCDESIFANSEEDSTPGLFGDPGVSSKKTARTPCGACSSCTRASRDQWLDLYWFDPESSDEGTRLGTHKIEAFRELKGKLGLGPSSEPFKIVVIADADRMTPAAANSILKMLEEPPRNWIFILTASESSRLLPTILSRCMEVKLAPIPSGPLFSILKASKGLDFNSTRGQVAARSANGSLTRALQFSSEEVWTLREQILGLLSSPAHEWTKLVEALSKSQIQAHLGLDLLESVFSDILLAQIKNDSHEWTNQDQRDLLLQISEVRKLGPDRLCRILESLAEKRKLVSLPLNAKLLAQEILIPVLEVL
jgi:DNA polymerase-3 subunit delta'